MVFRSAEGGMMMGVWFTATEFVGRLAGVLVKIAGIPENVQIPISEFVIYHSATFYYSKSFQNTTIKIILLS